MFVYTKFVYFIHQFSDCISVASNTFASQNFIFTIFLPLNSPVKLCYERFSNVISIRTGYTVALRLLSIKIKLIQRLTVSQTHVWKCVIHITPMRLNLQRSRRSYNILCYTLVRIQIVACCRLPIKKVF